MKTIIFVCHGSICRSPAASLIFNHLKAKYNLQDYTSFARATSLEEIGNDIYPPMKRVLIEHDVPLIRHYAQRLTNQEIEEADIIFYMDNNNYRNLVRQYGENKKYVLISKYLDDMEIEDPWYTDRYEFVFDKIYRSIEAIINTLIK